jgi:hypothetical protein
MVVIELTKSAKDMWQEIEELIANNESLASNENQCQGLVGLGASAYILKKMWE